MGVDVKVRSIEATFTTRPAGDEKGSIEKDGNDLIIRQDRDHVYLAIEDLPAFIDALKAVAESAA